MAFNKVVIVGIGTDVGKTVAAAIIIKALEATYYKPIQCGFADGTDKKWVQNKTNCTVIPETYLFSLPASPHLAAENENVEINLPDISATIESTNSNLVIEAAGGIMVPLNKEQTFLNALAIWNLPTIIVSRNYLGSINHSLLTSFALKANGINKCAWLFNDHFMEYEKDIVSLSGITSLGKIPFIEKITSSCINQEAEKIKPYLLNWLNN
jgi:dethiobiotin synthetase